MPNTTRSSRREPVRPQPRETGNLALPLDQTADNASGKPPWEEFPDPGSDERHLGSGRSALSAVQLLIN
jgi:hypothetical protein